MAALNTQQAATSGTALTLSAATSGGDTLPTGSAALITNGGGSSITVTVDVPGNTKYAQANPDIAVAIAAGATKLIGPFPSDLANPSDARVHLTYSAVTSVTIAAISI